MFDRRPNIDSRRARHRLPELVANWARDEEGIERPVDPRRRLGLVALALWAGLGIVAVALVRFELRWAERYQHVAQRPLERVVPLAAPRGRILSREGTVLAGNRPTYALAVAYRWLEEPPQPTWLRREARRRLAPRARRDEARLAAEVTRLRSERERLHRRLAALSGLSDDEWQRRVAGIQARVQRIVNAVNRRHAEGASLATGRGIGERIVVREELADHVVAGELDLAAVAELTGRPEEFPGVRIRELSTRVYPAGSLAAHALGYLGRMRPRLIEGDAATVDSDDPGWQGQAGVERAADELLAARAGELVERYDRSGEVQGQFRRREPRLGADVHLTLDARLQRTAELALDRALKRRWPVDEADRPLSVGGAAVLVDVRTGDLLAAASAPRFAPEAFVEGSTAELAALFEHPGRPLFDRVTGMALPPGRLTGLVTASAALEAGLVEADTRLPCSGAWGHYRPSSCRGAALEATLAGHGELDLVEACTRDCEVYFCELAAALEPEYLLTTARRLGWGARPGWGWVGESAGRLPAEFPQPEWTAADTIAWARGRGATLVTPLQMARLMAAIAHRGVLPTLRWQLPAPDEAATTAARPRAGRTSPALSAATLAALRRALIRASAGQGSPARLVGGESRVSLAGLSSSAFAGEGRAPHLWFAGYSPAEAPRVAVVVALEQAGNDDRLARAVAQHLVSRWQELGSDDVAPASVLR